MYGWQWIGGLHQECPRRHVTRLNIKMYEVYKYDSCYKEYEQGISKNQITNSKVNTNIGVVLTSRAKFDQLTVGGFHMTQSYKIRSRGLTCELPCVPCVIRPPYGACLGSQSELTWIQPRLLDPRSNKSVAMTKRASTPVQLLTWLWRLTYRWHDS